MPGNEAEARHLLEKAYSHVRTAASVSGQDPEIAYGALYAASRKALTGLLIQQGLRPTRAGGHDVVIEAAVAQLVPSLGDVLRPFRRIKRRRNDGDYAGSEDRLHAEDVDADLPAAAAIVDAVARLIPGTGVPIAAGESVLATPHLRRPDGQRLPGDPPAGGRPVTELAVPELRLPRLVRRPGPRFRG